MIQLENVSRNYGNGKVGSIIDFVKSPRMGKNGIWNDFG